jgi:hypothetical protein
VLGEVTAVETMSNDTRGWPWAYAKIRSLHCGRFTALFRATLYVLFGDTGRFKSRGGQILGRLKR